jgi:RNase P/RNase MRP subunit p30
MLEVAREMGYRAVAVEGQLSDFPHVEGLEVVRRVTLRADGVNQLHRELSRVRWAYEVVSVVPESREVAMAALRDNRVDTVVMLGDEPIPVDHHVAEVARAAVEVPLRRFLEEPDASFSWLFSSARWFRRGRVKVVVSSGAMDQLELRTPVQLASLLIVAGVEPDVSRKAVSDLPYSIQRENALRLKGLMDHSGVWEVLRD